MAPSIFALLLFFIAPSQSAIAEPLPQNRAGSYLRESLGSEARVSLILNLAASMAEKYVFWESKNHYLGATPREHMRGCARRERGISASTRLAFEARVMQCLAKFRDTHLQAQAQVEGAALWAGLEVAETGAGEFRISRVSRALLTHLEKNPSTRAAVAMLQPGARILSVNGLSPEEWIVLLAPYISSSSAPHLRKAALRAIFSRNFLFPAKGELRLRLESGEALLPWWQKGLNQRSDLRDLFARKGIRHVSVLGDDYESELRLGNGWDGFSEETALPSIEPLADFLDERSQAGLRMGEIGVPGGRRACYAQLLTFQTRSWRPVFSSRISVPFSVPLESFAAACGKKGLPLVLDLRSNPGGDPEQARKLLAAFGRPGARYGGILFSARRTAHTEQVLEQYDLGEGYPIPQDPLSHIRLRLEALRIAEREKAHFLPWVSQENIEIPAGKGFSGKIVVLTSPFCISTCEIAVHLFRNAGIALHAGEPTNGTGGRFLEIGESPTASWRDDLHGTLLVKLPNSLFSVSEKPREERDPLFFEFRSQRRLRLENKPLTPAVSLRATREDLQGRGSALLDEVLGLAYR